MVKSIFAFERFSFLARLRLFLLATVMVALWFLAVSSNLTFEEQELWEHVRTAQMHLAKWRQPDGREPFVDTDPWQYGLIGVEWSGITTTLGELAAKRTACNPTWAVQFRRWFQELHMQPGDPIAVYSSGSFPGLLFSALAAAENMGLEPLLVVSLGSSTWGANDPDYPWPVIASELRRQGFLRTRAAFYTLGAGSELGNGLVPEGEHLLRSLGASFGVRLLDAASLDEMIDRKTDLLIKNQSKLLISIGGSHANMGNDDRILKLPPGLISLSDKPIVGNGVIGNAVRNSIPVLHLLNLKALSQKVGIPYDTAPYKKAPAKVGPYWSLLGVILFFLVLWRHRRWSLEYEKMDE